MRRMNVFLIAAVFCVMISGIIFYYNNIIMPAVSKDAELKVRAEIDDKAMPRVKAAVVTGKEGISKYTVLTDEIIGAKIKLIDIPVKYAADNIAVDVDMLRGRITKEDLRYGEQVVLDSLSTETKWFGEYDRLKEYKVASIVAGEVKSGNIVDIVVTYNNGDYDVVIGKTKVRKLIDENAVTDAKSKPNDLKQSEHTIIIAVDEEQYKDLELAQKLGKLETRLYLDESQPPSLVTFNSNNSASKAARK